MHLSPNYLDSDGHQNSPAHIQFISLQTCAMWHTSQHMKFVAVSETYTARCIFSFTQFISLQPCAMKCTSSMHMKFIALPQTYTATFIFLTSLSLSVPSRLGVTTDHHLCIHLLLQQIVDNLCLDQAQVSRLIFWCWMWSAGTQWLFRLLVWAKRSYINATSFFVSIFTRASTPTNTTFQQAHRTDRKLWKL